MWLFTRYGMYSVVCASDLQDKHKALPDTLMVRARVQLHLKKLTDRFPELQSYPIQQNSGTDYKFRMIVPKAVFAPVMMELVTDIDYRNFKSEVHDSFRDSDPGGYASALHGVWGRMMDVQVRATGGATAWSKSTYSKGKSQPTLPFVEPQYVPGPELDSPEAFASSVPFDDEDVLVVYRKDGKARVPLCIVWWPDDYESPEQAYQEAVEKNVCASVTIKKRTSLYVHWKSVKDSKIPVYNYRNHGDEPDPAVLPLVDDGGDGQGDDVQNVPGTSVAYEVSSVGKM